MQRPRVLVISIDTTKLGGLSTFMDYGLPKYANGQYIDYTVYSIPEELKNATLPWTRKIQLWQGQLLQRIAVDIYRGSHWDMAFLMDYHGHPLIPLFKEHNIPFAYYAHLSLNGMFAETRKWTHNKVLWETTDWHKAICDDELYCWKEANARVACSSAAVKTLIERAELPYYVNYNGVDYESCQTFSAYPLPGDTAKKKVLFIGRLTWQKGIYNVINALPRIAQLQDVELYIAGPEGTADTYQGESILKIIDDVASKSKNIHYLGAVHGQDKINLLNSVDAVLMPSLYEPFGIVALEAMACGKPLITTRVTGIAEFVPERQCVPIRRQVDGSPEAVLEGIEMLKYIYDEQLMSMIDANRKIAMNFTWTATANKNKEIIESLIKND